MIDFARDIAKTYHAGQTDKCGVDYFEGHLNAVSSFFEFDSEDLQTVGILHDILEDTDCSVKILKRFFPDHIVDAVIAMTKIEGQDYQVYLEQVRANELSRQVKLADLRHNTSPNRATLSEKQVEKYAKAIQFLTN